MSAVDWMRVVQAMLAMFICCAGAYVACVAIEEHFTGDDEA